MLPPLKRKFLSIELPVDQAGFNIGQQYRYRYRYPYDLNRKSNPDHSFSVSGDLFWDEEKLKQKEINYLDALKGGEISMELKTP